MLPTLCGAAFMVFLQTFMVAPLIPRLAAMFGSSVGWVGFAVPAYVVPEAIATLWVGPLSDRLGRRRVITGSLLVFIVLTAATATADHVGSFIAWRIATGLSAAGIVPICLTLIGDVVPFNRRGRAVGWFFGAIAGGTATGAAVGALLEPLVGWRALFLIVAGLAAVLLVLMRSTNALPNIAASAAPWSAVAAGYRRLLASARGRRTYAYVLLNAVLQSGVFTWLGVYLHQRFGLGETGIGLVLLGYGVPGLLFGPMIGKLADRFGRSLIIPSGVALTGVCALLLAVPLPLPGVRIAIILLSLGFDLTHPQLAAITTDLGGGRGQAVAVMAFSLFGGFGLGSLLFQTALALGFTDALLLFGVVAFIAAALAYGLFRGELPQARRAHVAAGDH
ncbi:MAG TPA: MFS transporter [Rhodanobacteraceae bacterium]|nr:MFS transporter [Rhodanobacteraceae bacterium]